MIENIDELKERLERIEFSEIEKIKNKIGSIRAIILINFHLLEKKQLFKIEMFDFKERQLEYSLVTVADFFEAYENILNWILDFKNFNVDSLNVFYTKDEILKKYDDLINECQNTINVFDKFKRYNKILTQEQINFIEFQKLCMNELIQEKQKLKEYY